MPRVTSLPWAERAERIPAAEAGGRGGSRRRGDVAGPGCVPWGGRTLGGHRGMGVLGKECGVGEAHQGPR